MGSDAAAWKVKLLSATEAIVDVLAVDPVSTLRAAASESPHAPVRLHERAWRPKNLEGAALKGSCLHQGGGSPELVGPRAEGLALPDAPTVLLIGEATGADFKFKWIQRSTRAGSRDLYPLTVRPPATRVLGIGCNEP